MASFNKPTAFIGIVWMKEDGTYVYDCKFCRFLTMFPRSLEMHVTRYHEDELRPKQPAPDTNRPFLPRKCDENGNQPVPSGDVYCVPPPPPSSQSQSLVRSKPHNTVSTKSSSVSRSKVDFARRHSNPIKPHSPSKRMKLSDGTPARAAVEKSNPFASSAQRRRPIKSNHCRTLPTTPAATLFSKQPVAVPGRVYFGGRQTAPVEKSSPHKPTRRVTEVTVHSVVECHKCNQQFKGADSLQSHTQYCHKLVCVDCQTEQPKPFKTELGFWGHQRNQHAVIFKFKCKICVRAFKHQKELDQHLLDGAHANRIKVVVCGLCKRMFSSTFQKDEHIKANHKNCLAKKPIC